VSVRKHVKDRRSGLTSPVHRAKRQWTALTGPAPLRWLPEGMRRRALILRVGRASVREVTHGYLNLQAMSLVYTTLLSLVPLLAVSFSVLKGFGVHNQVQPLVLQLLRPLGSDKAHELTQQIIGFVDNVKVGVLGGVGLVLLLYTVLMLMKKIESALNYTWHTAEGRSLGRTFSLYLSVVTVGPILIFGALSLISALAADKYINWLAHRPVLETVISVVGQFAPYLILVVAFTFLYMAVPNVKVRFRPALVGAMISAAMWEFWGWLFASFLVNSVGYAIYAAFATLFMFMFWLYGSWLILLLGSSIAFYVQNPQYATVDPEALKLNTRARETIGVGIMREVMARFHAGAEPWTVPELAVRLDVPEPAVQWTICALCDGGLLLENDRSPMRVMLGRDPMTIQIAEIFDIIRHADSNGKLTRLPEPHDTPAANLVDRSEAARRAYLDGMTVRDLIDAEDESMVPEPASFRPPPVDKDADEPPNAGPNQPQGETVSS
jgi:membrane protein